MFVVMLRVSLTRSQKIKINGKIVRRQCASNAYPHTHKKCALSHLVSSGVQMFVAACRRVLSKKLIMAHGLCAGHPWPTSPLTSPFHEKWPALHLLRSRILIQLNCSLSRTWVKSLELQWFSCSGDDSEKRIHKQTDTHTGAQTKWI